MSRVRSVFLSLVCCVAMTAAGMVAIPTPVHANPNPIDWRVFDMFSFSFGIPMPLRYGQHDSDGEDGFGKFHIEDGHGIVPPHEDIQETINLPAPECVTKGDLRHVCVNEDLSLVVVFTENIEPASGDGLALGIITAYFFIPCLDECPPPVPGPTPSTLAYTGPDSVVNRSPAQMSAVLSDNLGIELPGQAVHFVVGVPPRQQQCSGTTDSNGSASCSVTIDQPSMPGVLLTVSYGGNADVQPSSITMTLNLHTPTVLRYTGPTVIANSQPTQMSGVLSEDTLAPVVGRTVTFSLGSGASAQTCVGITDVTGAATCAITPNRTLGPDSVRADFAGDGIYLPSSAGAAIIVFAFLDHGAMVLGDDSAAIGASVTYWGSQWAGDQLSDTPPPHAFKGFASGTSQPPACGSDWSTETGASSSPPSTVPAYMGVVVASSIGQSGSTIRGNTVAIVVVKTDPGYEPSPGHSGTGLVAAVFCSS